MFVLKDAAVAELEKDLERTFKAFLCGHSDTVSRHERVTTCSIRSGEKQP